jgi:TrpR-related protein YerC/YecD
MDDAGKAAMRQDLVALLAGTDDPELISLLLDDLCTIKEIEQMSERLRAAKLLLEGKTYNQVMEETSISTATLSRVSRCVQYGKGYSSLLKKTKRP